MIGGTCSKQNYFSIDYKYCSNAYMVADERCIEVPWMLQNIRDQKNKQMRVLDVGCSGSKYLNDLKEIGCKVYGNDIRDIGNETGLDGYFKGKIQDIDTGITFDAITCISVLEHIGLRGYGAKKENLKKAQISALKKISRMLTGDGLIYVSIPFGKKFIYYGGRRYPFFFKRRDERPTPLVEYNEKLLGEILCKSGVSIIKEEYYCWRRKRWETVTSDFLKNVKYGDFNACNATGIALLILKRQ